MNMDAIKRQAPDLTREFPRSPHATVGGFVIAARAVDKARAELAGTLGEYRYYPCGLFQMFLDFTGIDPQALKETIATGADDAAVGEWVAAHSKVTDARAISRWNDRMRAMTLADLPDDLRGFMEQYVAEELGRPVTVWFDVYDVEEGRLP